MTSNDTPPLGQGLAHHAFRLSGRIVAGVGQILLWLLNGLGRLLRPLAARTGAWLYGRKSG
ncbi:MAG: hypothetical protein QOE54_3286, partial [Streptosporangiaceae bacterium]|nr:hypothetical protein [Streptosporangiaceae bacterium]